MKSLPIKPRRTKRTTDSTLRPEAADAPASRPMGRREVLGAALSGLLLGVAGTVAVKDSQQANSYGNEHSSPQTDRSEAGPDMLTIEITREAAEMLKQQALNQAKTSFEEAGYSGAAQSDKLHAELEKPKARLTIDLGLNPGKHSDILALQPDDLEGFTVAYSSLSKERAAEPDDITRTPVTVPSIGNDESTQLYFEVRLRENYPKESPMGLPEYDSNYDNEQGDTSADVPNESSAGYVGPEDFPINSSEDPSEEFYPESIEEREPKYLLEITALRIGDGYPKQKPTAAELLETAFSDFR